jgi:hypothetical protein
MEFVNAVRILARRRVRVAVGLVVAILVGAHLAGVLPPRGSSGTRSAGGEALVRVLVDTRVPLAATTAQEGADTIMERTTLLADQMSGNEMAAAVAGRAGIASGQLAILGPTFAPVGLPTLLPDGQLPQLVAKAAATAVHQPYVVRLVPDSGAPIISIVAVAPDARRANSLAQATFATMRSATATTAGNRGLTVTQLGLVRSVVAQSLGSHHHMMALVAAVALFVAWCIAIVVGAGLARAWSGTRLEPKVLG